MTCRTTPALHGGNLVPSSGADIKSTSVYSFNLHGGELRGRHPGRSSPLGGGVVSSSGKTPSLHVPASVPALCSLYPAPPWPPGREKWARGSAAKPLGFTTKWWSVEWGVVWRIRGSKKHGLLANLRFWHVLCVTGNLEHGTLEVN